MKIIFGKIKCKIWWIKNTLKLRKGEEYFDTINYIEDRKANNGDIEHLYFQI